MLWVEAAVSTLAAVTVMAEETAPRERDRVASKDTPLFAVTTMVVVPAPVS